ncbi:MAG: hypothetical protein M3Z37_09540 [Candidatus Eremiobacteraeota bacterium]|nr:hypothetical protein [Candidatus Eremiobacteraeota bacterium]
MTSAPTARTARGIALITTLLAVALLMAIVAVLVNISSAQLRRTAEETRSLQALAAADAGASWVRALLRWNRGALSPTLLALAAEHSTLRVTIDANTHADVLVSLRLPAAAAQQPDYLDRQLQMNAQVLEAPVQVIATATLVAGGALQATRSVTTLLRVFHQASPYSEVVGLIDDGGPVAADSPGDAGGQVGASNATELRLHAYKDPRGRHPDDRFEDQQWNDGNAAASGFLP